MTLSLVQARRPRDLIGHLKKVRGYTVEETRPGIYTVTGDVFPIQLVDIRRLPEDENLWLKGLSNKLGVPAARKIVHEANLQGKGAGIGAYLEAIFQANAATIREAAKMGGTAVTFESVLEELGLIAKWEARGEARADARIQAAEAKAEARALDIARNMLGMGIPFDTVVSATGLDPEKVNGLYERQ